MAWRRWIPDEPPTFGRAVLVGFGAAAIGIVLRLVVQPAIGTDRPFITFFPVLLGAALWAGIGGGLVCLLLCSAVAIAFLLPRTDLQHLAASLLAFFILGGLITLAGSALATNVRDLRETLRRLEGAEGDLRTLVHELAHRERNGLAVVMSIITQSARRADTAQELAEIVNARLGAMADAQAEVVSGGGNSAALGALLERTLLPFDLGRFIFEPSPDLEIAPQTATGLALLTHELATNAVKHGALSSASGRVELAWRAAPGSVRLQWRERGGPSTREPSRDGFGTRLLQHALASQGGRAARRFEPEGLVCEIDFPYLGSGQGA